MIRPLATARRRVVLLASGTAVLLAVGGGATAAVASTAAGPSPSTTPAACRVHLRAELRSALPAALKADLKTLHAEPTAAKRAAERKVIRQKALSGAYGTQFEHRLHVVGAHHGRGPKRWASLPAALKVDLSKLRATAPHSAARTAERQQIQTKALAGDYGTTIQQRATTVKARLDKACAATTAK